MHEKCKNSGIPGAKKELAYPKNFICRHFWVGSVTANKYILRLV
jgi:hypothetical protein